MAEPTLFESCPIDLQNSYCFDTDLSLPDFTEFDLDDFSIDEFLRSPDHSGGFSTGSPDSGGCSAGSPESSASGVTSHDVKQERDSKPDLTLKRKICNDDSQNPNPRGEEDEEKKKARLVRNRESAQLSRQRKKKYVEELEEKVRSMHSVINDLNAKISFVMAENASLKQQVGGNGNNLAAPSVYPPPGMHFPWIPGYALRPSGAPVPLVPIPRLKPQNPAPVQKPKKQESKKTKKVASISILGLLFVMMIFGAVFPGLNSRLANISHGRFLKSGLNSSEEIKQSVFSQNSSETLPALLYVPRNGKHVKINGNLIIHSFLASEKAMAHSVTKDQMSKPDGKEGKDSTSLAVAKYVDQNSNKFQENSKPSLSDGTLPQWFTEGMAGPILSSGMCTEVFQFEVSPVNGVVPATSPIINSTNSPRNSTTESNLQNNNKMKRNRRIMHAEPIPLPGKTALNNNKNGTDEAGNRFSEIKPDSKVVVSVLADPRETGDGENSEGRISPKPLSRVFVVVLLDGVKYVTYSCMLPFKSFAPHLVN